MDSTGGCNIHFAANLFDTIETLRLFLPHIRNGNPVQFITSFLTRAEFPGLSIYGASKPALKSLSQTLAAELVPKDDGASRPAAAYPTDCRCFEP